MIERANYYPKPDKPLAYNPSFDRRDFRSLDPYDLTEKERLASYIDKQIDTHLGERFNVLQSTVTYDIRDGQIFGQDTKEPFLDVIKKGVKTEREQAELEGFEKIQDFFVAEAKEGDMMLSISPPGGEYLHNFYDVFTLKKGEKGKFIEMNRFSSALTISDYQEKLKPFKTFAETPQESDFLKKPILVNKALFPKPEDLHRYLHKNHEFLTNEQFEIVKKSVQGLKRSYIDSLSQTEEMQFITLNAIYNQADISLQAQKEGNGVLYELQSFFKVPTKQEIYILGMQPVRIVQTPCGASGGFSIGGAKEVMNSPFRIFDKSKDEQKWFSCPKCKYKADGPVGDTCPGCKLTKEEFAKSGGQVC